MMDRYRTTLCGALHKEADMKLKVLSLLLALALVATLPIQSAFAEGIGQSPDEGAGAAVAATAEDESAEANEPVAEDEPAAEDEPVAEDGFAAAAESGVSGTVSPLASEDLAGAAAFADDVDPAPAEERPVAGQFVIVVEKLILGQGYLYEPQIIEFYSGDSVARALSRLFGTGNFKTGSRGVDLGEYDKGFAYLSSIRDPNRAYPENPPDFVKTSNAYPFKEDTSPEFLGEFDYTGGSGWMYTAVYAGVGGLGTYPVNNDVVRLCFVVGNGLNSFSGNAGNVSRNELARKLAFINSSEEKAELLAVPGIRAAYDDANAVYCDLESAQNAIDTALEALIDAMPADSSRITYHINGGKGSVADDNEYEIGATAALNSGHDISHPDDKLLANWNTRADGTGNSYLPGSSVTMSKDIILYAIWEDEYSLVYNVNAAGGGGTTATPASVLVFPRREVTLPSLGNNRAETGKVFKEWNTEPDGMGTSYKSGAKMTMPGQNVTLYAVWTQGYRVSYNGNGHTAGTVPNTTVYTVPGASVTINNNTTLYNDTRRISSWNTEANGTGDAYAFSQVIEMPDRDINLYAVYSDTCLALFDFNDDSGKFLPTVNADYYLPGQLVYKAVAASKASLTIPEGWDFKEWNTEPDGTGYSASAAGNRYTITEQSVTFYAIYEKLTELSFDANGGEGPLPATNSAIYSSGGMYYNHGNGVPTKDGYRIKEWNTKPDGTGTSYRATGTVYYTFESAEDAVLYAIYYTKTITVRYDLNGGVSGKPDDMTDVYPGEGAALRDADNNTLNRNGAVHPTGQQGMVFKGWSLDPEDTVGNDYMDGFPDKDVVILYAVWAPGLAVAYDLNGATGTTPANDHLYGGNRDVSINVAASTNIVPPQETVFQEWNTSPDGTGYSVRANANVNIANLPKEYVANITFYAICKPQYVLKYNLNGGTGNLADSAKTFSGANITISTTIPTKDGVTFRRWNTEPDGSGIDYSPREAITVVDGDITLYARWTANKVLYDLNGGTGTVPPDDAFYVPNAEVAVPGASGLIPPEDCRFIAWNTEADGSGAFATPGETIHIAKGDMTLYAIWRDIGVEDDLDFHMAKLLESVPAPVLGTIGGEWSVLALARAGYAVPKDYYTEYYKKVAKELADNNGVLSAVKYTEYSRVIMAFSAIGYDPGNIAGYNMIAQLVDMNKIMLQGINGPIFALIALDSNSYGIAPGASAENRVTRDKLIEAILSREISGGGWALTGDMPDADVTAMALQALAPYKDRSDIQPCIARALTALSGMQDASGRFGGEEGICAESTAQVVIALSALGVNPKTDARFVKSDGNTISALLLYTLQNGGFEHILGGGYDPMATDQGLLGLVAFDRFLNGETSLYNMTDVTPVQNPDYVAPGPKDNALTNENAGNNMNHTEEMPSVDAESVGQTESAQTSEARRPARSTGTARTYAGDAAADSDAIDTAASSVADMSDGAKSSVNDRDADAKTPRIDEAEASDDAEGGPSIRLIIGILAATIAAILAITIGLRARKEKERRSAA
jgi:hypothetical protein